MLKEQMEIWFQNYQIILYNRWFYKDFDIVMAKKHDKIELKTLLIRKVQATHICILRWYNKKAFADK